MYQLSGLIFSSDEPLPELHPVDGGPPEVSIVWSTGTLCEDGPAFSAWLTPSGREWLTFADTEAGFLLTFADHSQFLVSPDASRVTVRPFPGTPLATTRHLLLNQVLPLVLSRRGRLVLHASAVSLRGRVCAFIGRSGAGKSTMAAACAAAGAAIVSDDCLVVRRVAGRWMAMPYDAGVRLWPHTLELLGWERRSGAGMAHYTNKRRVGAPHPALTFETEVLPLARIFRLSCPDEAVAAGTLRGHAAVMALASELFRLDSRDAQESLSQFEAIGALATDVPMEASVRQHPAVAAAAVLCRM